MSHHVIHRLVRDYISRGAHDIDVKRASNKPRRYYAACNECEWMSTVGTGAEADSALEKHRDETVRRLKTSEVGRTGRVLTVA